MQLHIKDIGPIGSAEVDLTGLTVIGGLNDTGKSTIGKVLFSIVKSIRNRDEQFNIDQQNRISPIISELISELRSSVGPIIQPSNYSNIVRRLQDIRRFSGDNGLALFDVISEDITEHLIEEARRREPLIRRITLGKESSNLEQEWENKIVPSIRNITSTYLIKIRNVVSEQQNLIDIYTASFNSVFNAVFNSEINNKRSISLTQGGTIKLIDNIKCILEISFKHSEVNESALTLDTDAISSLFDDVTLLETPFALNFKNDLILAPRNSNGNYLANYPTYDLLEKLSFASRESDSQANLEREIIDIIGKVIDGEIYFDQDTDEFVFASNDKVNIRITNTASGIKSLGILQMLARAGVLVASNLLLVDEPEVHLHPGWQITYAEIIAILVKRYNIYCLVSSHSPYFIQAIEAYSKIYKMENLTKFYVSEKNEGSCTLRDITNNPEPLYKLLADPMKRIAYLRAKAQNE
ncbi:MAG: AAA family ATPase [Janthinobacterium lividum]